MVTLPMVTTLVGSVLKLIVAYFLIGNEDIGIKGGAISTVVCFWLIALLDLFIIKRTLPRSLSLRRVFLKPAAAAAAMGLSAWAFYGLACKAMLALGVKLKTSIFVLVDQLGEPILDELGAATLSRTGVALSVLIPIGIAVIVYFALILVTKAISKEDLALIPKGDKIARILRVE